MSLASAVHTHTTKTASCPHGLPPGACPVCSGISGGNSTTKRDIPRNAGEMTYNQCAAIGAMLRAQKHARQQAEIAQQNHLQALAEFQKTLANTHQKILGTAANISKIMPAIIAKPANFILTNIAAKALNLIQNIPAAVINITDTISKKIADITDKLAAVYGEFKAAVSEKISKFTQKIKKKLKSLLFIFGTDETDDEDKKIEEAKRIFELKTFVHKLFGKIKEENKKDSKKDEYSSD